jgi:ketol-acid reductoisomerase
MKQLLADIQSGAFADEWMAECAAGKPNMKRLAEKEANHPAEVVGKRLRALMPFIQGGK